MTGIGTFRFTRYNIADYYYQGTFKDDMYHGIGEFLFVLFILLQGILEVRDMQLLDKSAIIVMAEKWLLMTFCEKMKLLRISNS